MPSLDASHYWAYLIRLLPDRDNRLRMISEQILRSYGWPYPLGADVIISADPHAFSHLQLRVRMVSGRGYHYLKFNSWWRRTFSVPLYRNLRPYVVFEGVNVDPLIVDGDGQVVCGWDRRSKKLLLGFDLENEVLLYRQGNPSFLKSTKVKSGFGFEFERPLYLYADNIDSRYPFEPWVDKLLFFTLSKLSEITGLHRKSVLPRGLKGLIVLTGDDDQAELAKYADQQRELDGAPITYFLVSKSNLTREHIEQFENVDFGVHPDALHAPHAYPEVFESDLRAVEDLTHRKINLVRNHGYLNKGYWGHLGSWIQHGVSMSSNIPGVDGTCHTGSFLAVPVQDGDGNWTSHMSILTAFGDGMLYALKMSERQAIKRVKKVMNIVERSGAGALVFNLHPQNIDSTRLLHRYLIKEVRNRQGWGVMSLGQYWNFCSDLISADIKCWDDINAGKDVSPI